MVHTGYVPAFKLYSSHTVFVHCNLKLCLVGEKCPLKDEVNFSAASCGPTFVCLQCFNQSIHRILFSKGKVHHTSLRERRRVLISLS